MRQNWFQVSVLLAGLLCVLLAGAAPVADAAVPWVDWQHLLGGNLSDGATDVLPLASGGYMVAGSTSSVDGDVAGNHGGTDAWVVQLAPDGELVWQRCIGGTGWDMASAIRPTTDGGYIVAGSTTSDDANVTGSHGAMDFWVVKIDTAGTVEWYNRLGGSGDDGAGAVQQTADGGYIVAGTTKSSQNDGDIAGHHGSADAWVVKLDADGGFAWQRCLGGSDYEYGDDVQQTADGGYLVAGSTGSIYNDGDVSGHHGRDDAWIVKLDAAGTVVWQRCLGGSRYDYAHAVEQTADGGYIAVGGTNSYDGDVAGRGDEWVQDIWAVKLDADGNLVWQKAFDVANHHDDGFDIRQTADGGYILAGGAGYTGACSGGAVVAFWVAKLDPVGGLQWSGCYAADEVNWPRRVQTTPDGGCIMVGVASGYFAPAPSDAYVLRLKPVTNALPGEVPICVNLADQRDPDIYGQYVVWEDDRNGNADIFLKDLLSGAERQISPSGAGEDRDPAIHRHHIVYVREVAGNDSVQVHNLITRQTKTLVTGSDALASPDIWTVHDGLSDQVRVVWERSPAGGNQIYLSTYLDTLPFTTVTTRPTHTVPTVPTLPTIVPPSIRQISTNPWSVGPRIDGDHVVWDGAVGDPGSGPNYEIYLYTLSNGSEQRLTDSTVMDLHPSLSGDRAVWMSTASKDWITADIAGYTISTGDTTPVTVQPGGSPRASVLPAIDGGDVVWTEQVERQLYTYNWSTGTTRRVTDPLAKVVGRTGPAVEGRRAVWVDDRNGNADIFMTAISDGTVTPTPIITPVPTVPPWKFNIRLVPGGTGLPTDTDGDWKYDDVNGNGRPDFADVVLYFNQMTWIAANEPGSLFDYNLNGRIDFADVVWLFNRL